MSFRYFVSGVCSAMLVVAWFIGTVNGSEVTDCRM